MLPNVATPATAFAVEPPATLVGLKASAKLTVPVNAPTALPHGSSAVTATLAIVLSNSVSVGWVVNTRWLLPTLVVTLLRATKSLPAPLKSLDCLTCVGQTTLHAPVGGAVTDTETEIDVPGLTPLPRGPVLVRRKPVCAAFNAKWKLV